MNAVACHFGLQNKGKKTLSKGLWDFASFDSESYLTKYILGNILECMAYATVGSRV
jgi:hypothetical protein